MQEGWGDILTGLAKGTRQGIRADTVSEPQLERMETVSDRRRGGVFKGRGPE